MTDETRYKYGGTLVCSIDGPGASKTDSPQYMVGAESAYQYPYNTAFDNMKAGPSYVAAAIEYVEHESYNPIPLNQPHAIHTRLGGLGTTIADIILFENEAAVSYDPNSTDDKNENDDDAESDGNDSGDSSVEEDVPSHEAPLVPTFRLVDASDDDETISYGALPEHLFFYGNEKLRKRMVFRSKEQV